MAKLKIALVHDDLVQWGGAERVFAKLTRLFPDASVYSCCVDFSNTNIRQAFAGREIQTSFMQSIPGWKFGYKAMLGLYPLALESFDFSGFDLVISHTTRFAKQIVTSPKTYHVCYCHTPPRFLWGGGAGKLGLLAETYMSYLRWQDQIVANRVDSFIAGSENAKERIKKIYKVNSEVLYPFVEEKFFDCGKKSFDGGYYLVVSRLVNYKKVDEVVEAFRVSGRGLIVIGSGPQEAKIRGRAGYNVRIITKVMDEVLASLIAGCKAVVVAGEEDFGLVSLEAQAMGKPVIAYRAGGSLESVVEGQTGVFFTVQRSEFINEAIDRFEGVKFNKDRIVENARGFDEANFERRLFEIMAKRGYYL